MTDSQRSVFDLMPTIRLVAECVGKSRSIIVRVADGRLYYLTPGGLFRRCR